MKNYFGKVCSTALCLFALFSSLQTLADQTVEQPAASHPGILLLEISGLKDKEGDIYVAVFDSEHTWLGDDTVLQQKVDIQSSLRGEMVTTEAQLPVGEYALSVFYDENGNGDLDTNFIGIPKEPIALSNNAKMRFGPPKYEDAKFDLGLEPVLQRIIMVVADD
jgi:uncharacterized protein (DUF2141 family)